MNKGIKLANWKGIGEYDYIAQVDAGVYEMLVAKFSEKVADAKMNAELCDGWHTYLISYKRNSFYPVKQCSLAYGSGYNGNFPFEEFVEGDVDFDLLQLDDDFVEEEQKS